MTTVQTIGSGSSGNCHVLWNDDKALVLDCGVPMKVFKPAVDFNVSAIDGAVITHSHKDHCLARKDFIKMGIPVLAPFESEDKRVSSMFGDFKIRSFQIRNKDGRWLHTNSDGSDCPICGFLISTEDRSILYATDFEYLPFTFRNQMLDSIIISCNHEDDAEYDNEAKARHVYLGHASLSTTRDIVLANQTGELKNVILCHLSAEADGELMVNELRKAVGKNVNVTIAEEGKTIILK